MKNTAPRSVIVLLTVLSLSQTSMGQTYTNTEFVASAPLAWQVQHDPASRLSIGPDDGNVSAAVHTTDWASSIRYGGAQGLEGLLYDFTISAEGPPLAFGLARHGCAVFDDASTESCIKARWTPFYFDGQLAGMNAILSYNDFALSHLETNVNQGDSFSIERVGNGTINFYRSTGTPGERARVFSGSSPFLLDGYPATTFIEARSAFSPGSAVRKVSWAQEIYYCCL